MRLSTKCTLVFINYYTKFSRVKVCKKPGYVFVQDMQVNHMNHIFFFLLVQCRYPQFPQPPRHAQVQYKEIWSIIFFRKEIEIQLNSKATKWYLNVSTPVTTTPRITGSVTCRTLKWWTNVKSIYFHFYCSLFCHIFRNPHRFKMTFHIITIYLTFELNLYCHCNEIATARISGQGRRHYM